MKITTAIVSLCLPAALFGAWAAIPYLLLAAIAVLPFELLLTLAAGPRS